MRLRTLLLTAAAALAVAPQAAHASAAIVSYDTGTQAVSISGTGGVERLAVTRTSDTLVKVSPGTGNEVSVFNGTGCDPGTGGEVVCEVANVTHVRIDATLGAGDDHLMLDTPTLRCGHCRGEGGADQLWAAAGDDTLDGGDGDDLLQPGQGNDVVMGGAATDMVFYGERSAGVTVTLTDSSSSSGNGASGESDVIAADVEDVHGGTGNDTLAGNGAVNRFYAGPGDDTVTSRDSVADSVSCYTGADRVIADATDTYPHSDCETVELPAVPQQPHPEQTVVVPEQQPAHPAPDTAAPLLSRLRLSPATMVRPKRRLKAAKLTFELSEPATVTFTVFQKAPGRKVGGKCVKRSHKNRRAKRCDRLRAVKGTIAHEGTKGANSLTFTGKLGKTVLPEARYLLVAVAVDAAGNEGAKDKEDFRVKG